MISATTFFLLLILMFSSSPLKLSLTLAAISTFMGLFSYQLTNSIFIPSAVIISFSSGMMILFSYCSMLSNHESKNNLKTNPATMTLALTSMAFVTHPSSYENSMQKMTLECTQSLLLIFLMAVVIISMICMNMSFFNPTKKFMQSY